MNSCKKLAWLLYLITLGLLSSCAQYDTRYTPPTNPDGMSCLQSCLSNLQACNNNCNDKKMIKDITRTVAKALVTNKYEDQNYFYHSDSNDDCGCKKAYDYCYRSCGGDVKYVCIANCGN